MRDKIGDTRCRLRSNTSRTPVFTSQNDRRQSTHNIKSIVCCSSIAPRSAASLGVAHRLRLRTFAFV